MRGDRIFKTIFSLKIYYLNHLDDARSTANKNY